MFGYIKPLKCELKIREYDSYRAAYCGLCNALRVRYGFIARFIVNYDFTFISLILSYAENCKGSVVKKRCIACPAGRKCIVSDVCNRVADISVILAYLKLCDDVADNGFIKGLFKARLPRILIRPSYNKAKRALPQYASDAKKLFDELCTLENRKIPSIDETADKFALMLSAVAEGEGNTNRILRELFYHIGRFVYIIDALDDIGQDARSGEYNPIAERFGETSGKLSDETIKEITLTLNHSINAVLSAFELLKVRENDGLIRNIIELGMPNVAATVIKKEK